ESGNVREIVEFGSDSVGKWYKGSDGVREVIGCWEEMLLEKCGEVIVSGEVIFWSISCRESGKVMVSGKWSSIH
ncbi:3153_t:CDS:2, partial [Dentiscutata heterogama]